MVAFAGTGGRAMPLPSSSNVTQLLVDWNQGNASALDKLMPMVYQELRRLAGAYLRRERVDHTLAADGAGA